MVLINEQSKSVKNVIILTDLSLSPQSFNQFDIEEGVDFEQKVDGDYIFKVYQMPTDTDTDYKTNGFLVKTGKARLLKENEPTTKQYSTDTSAKIYK